jgi:glycosyltransferase involved in cell wall biosynthesis
MFIFTSKQSVMNIGIIIPDRNDRPELLENCLRMIENQTTRKYFLHVVNAPPLNSDCDITYRYRKGYEYFSGKGIDCILFMENDDYYSPEYIEVMVNEWVKHGKPDLFGTAYTIYYHIGLLKWERMDHPQRASAMNTLIKPDLDIKWPVDHEPYTDIHLWTRQEFKGVTFKPEKPISVGMKHGSTLTGGSFHNDRLTRYRNIDYDFEYLQKLVDRESFNFYKSFHERIQSNFR